jgi:lipid A 4'-phosphatase
LQLKEFREKVENFLDGPGDVEKNRSESLGRMSFLSGKPAATITFIIAVVLSLFFYIMPQVDIGVSKLFFLGNRNFMMVDSPIGHFFHSTLVTFMVIFLVVVGVIYIIGEFLRKPLLTLTRRRVLLIILAISLSAGFVTNFVLKNHWGRARPRDVIEFGGDKQFTPAGEMSNQCTKNCSFVSGEASFAFSFICFALLARRHRRFWFWALMAFASSVALMRVAMGAHFLSDSVLGAVYTIFVVFIVERLVINRDLPAADT